jgi:Ca2+-transporting ATPase
VDSESIWHTLPSDQVAKRLGTDVVRGLTAQEAAQRLGQHGPNELAVARRRSWLSMLVHQFRSILVALLAVAAGIAVTMGESVEAIAISIVIILNALIGFITELKAELALEGLRKEAVTVAQVVRDGVRHEIPAKELVPGDVVVLSEGVRVPADGRLAEQKGLSIDESALTGESVASEKNSDPVPAADSPLGDRADMVYMGTAVADGRGRFIVTATGMQTEMGNIGTLVAEAETRRTPIEEKLVHLSRVLLVVVLVVAAVIVVAGWLRGNELLSMLEIGISLAIAAVPEGLPAVTTMTLALGMRRMARMHALIRRLPAVETLGSTTVICTDKTGTLTRNEMTVRAFALGGQRIDVTGSGYAPTGEFRTGDSPVAANGNPLALALRIGALCNDAKVDRGTDPVTILGDPTEAALIVAAEKGGMDRADLVRNYPRVAEVPFSSETKRMTTVHRAPDGRVVAYVKGAPGPLLESSTSHIDATGVVPLGPEDRKRWETTNEELARLALRVLGLAYRELPDKYVPEDLSRDLIFVGEVGMFDPLREEASRTIEICHQAGIRTIMITGDQAVTAAEIARQLGIDRDSGGQPLKIVHVSDLGNLDGPGWQDVVRTAAVFARVSPQHKLQIVEALQETGNIVAMTGDGVNDAPALKQADIGVAMGIKGTEVAKDTSDMIITDDNFATIVGAVEQGRIIVNNILRFIHYLFSCNFAEIITVFAAILLGWPLPLAALQILWLNMITDIFPALALALEPSAPDVMKRPPRDPKEPLMTWSFARLIVWQGMLIAGVTLSAFYAGMQLYGSDGDGLSRAVTIAFMSLALAQVFHAFNARSRTRSAFSDRLFTNAWLWSAALLCVLLQLAAVYVPLLQRTLGTVPPVARDWALIAAATATPVVVVEIVKAAGRRRARR